MAAIARTDSSILGRWWWTVDRWALFALFVLAAVGLLLTATASPAVAERLNLSTLHFVRRQAMMLLPAMVTMLAVSLLTPRQIRRLAVVVFAVMICLLLLTLISGTEIKGARRWISVAGFSLQPSEFVKPAFAVTAAWMFAARRLGEEIPGNLIAMGLLGLVLSLLLAQPDIGQAFVISSVWFTQFFLAGLSMVWVMAIGLLGIAGLTGAYFVFPHVASRIDRFIDPSSGDSYQVDRALQAFAGGGIFGRGPGEGAAKLHLPDAHADFILAVAGEEFGMIACLLIVAIFMFIILRGFMRVLQENNLFVVLAATGLLVQFALQALINMGSTLNLIPTKGMTLPFISYGGSSLLALGLAMGMMLALTRRHAGDAP
ncbi:MAG: putative lipid II flippase FtsW [Alphaproteobacteria bacterium]